MPGFSITDTELLSSFEKIDFGRLIPIRDYKNGKDSLFKLIRLAICYSIAVRLFVLGFFFTLVERIHLLGPWMFVGSETHQTD